ncbi:MAG: WD40/YVTN/BNR-like repeat-containing protein, partial [Steroidobacteraceae bacterium]
MPGQRTGGGAAVRRSRRRTRALPSRLPWLLALALAQSAPAQDTVRFAQSARLAAHSLLIAIAAAGQRLVAVGDRGVIVLSDDRGRSWQQATSVPTQALLTGVCFFDARHGLAVGHDEVVLATADAGGTWRRTHYAPGAQRPLLDVWCGAGGEAIAVGAYSTYLTSTDGGAGWVARKFTAAPAPKGASGGRAGAASSAGDPGAGGGYHLNRIVAASAARLYIAGEAGHLYRSDDGGANWHALFSPYEGSFFDILPLAGDALLAFGLRGNLFRSEDAGGSWRRLDTGTVAMLDGAARLAGGQLAIVGLSGVVLLSGDGGESFALRQQSDRSGLSAALAVGRDTLAVVGEDGARLIA